LPGFAISPVFCARVGRKSDTASAESAIIDAHSMHGNAIDAGCCYRRRGAVCVCLSVCWSRPRSLQKRSNRLRCSSGEEGSRGRDRVFAEAPYPTLGDVYKVSDTPWTMDASSLRVRPGVANSAQQGRQCAAMRSVGVAGNSVATCSARFSLGAHSKPSPQLVAN